MKVLITTDLYLPSVNGVVTSVRSLVHGERVNERQGQGARASNPWVTSDRGGYYHDRMH